MIKIQDTRYTIHDKKYASCIMHRASLIYSPIAIFFFLLFTIHYSLFTATAEGAQLAGKITKVAGRVDILRAGTTIAVPIRINESVFIGDILRTKSDGKAEITFIDNSVMSVGPRSRLGIDEYLYKPDESKRTAAIKLYRGKTGFRIPRPVYAAEGSKFEMKTRTAVAGVRGTEGILFTDGIERVYVKDGLVEFKNPLGTVLVSRGEVGEILFGRAPTERPYSEKEFKKQEDIVKPKGPDKKTEGDRTQPTTATTAPEPAAMADVPAISPPSLPVIQSNVVTATTQITTTTTLLTTTQPVIPITDITGASANTDVNINVNFPVSNVNVNVVFQ
ncbi:MAG: FecR domain-containing protein [Nitrospirae bacterium]|nr:FecR domain-containing protein [Nitrospirota bacterium]